MIGDGPYLIFFLIAVAVAFWVSRLAKDKGYDGGTWLLAGLLCWPIALLLIAGKPRNPKVFRRCGDCGADDVPYNVPVCRHCGRDERRQTGVGPAT